MPYSPQGLYVGESQAELDRLRAEFKAAMTGGQRTSISGGGKNGSKTYQMKPQDGLLEVKYAEQQNGTRSPRPQKVYQNLTPCNDVYPYRQ